MTRSRRRPSTVVLWGLEAGLHAYLDLGTGVDPAAVVACAAAQQVIVSGLDDYYIGPPDRRGVLLVMVA